MNERRICPDGGTCHHDCQGESPASCSRVLGCAPLSGVFPGNVWPREMSLAAMVLAVEVQQGRSNHVKVHCNNLGPYSPTNPMHCIHCRKLGSFWKRRDESCPGNG